MRVCVINFLVFQLKNFFHTMYSHHSFHLPQLLPAPPHLTSHPILRQLYRFKPDRFPELRGVNRQVLPPLTKMTPLTYEKKIDFCNGVSLNILTTLQGWPQAQQQIANTHKKLNAISVDSLFYNTLFGNFSSYWSFVCILWFLNYCFKVQAWAIQI